MHLHKNPALKQNNQIKRISILSKLRQEWLTAKTINDESLKRVALAHIETLNRNLKRLE